MYPTCMVTGPETVTLKIWSLLGDQKPHPFYCYNKYLKNAEAADEFQGLSFCHFWYSSYILLTSQGGGGARCSILTAHVSGVKKVEWVLRDIALSIPAAIQPGFEGIYSGSLNYLLRQRVPIINHVVTKCLLPYICQFVFLFSEAKNSPIWVFSGKFLSFTFGSTHSEFELVRKLGWTYCTYFINCSMN